MVLIAGMAPDTEVFSLNKEKEKDKLQARIRTRVIWVMSESHDHYTTRELDAGKQLF